MKALSLSWLLNLLLTIPRLLKVGFVHAMPADAILVYVKNYMQSILVRMQLTTTLTVLCREHFSFYLKIMHKVFIGQGCMKLSRLLPLLRLAFDFFPHRTCNQY